VPVPLIVYHFKSKEQLWRDAVNEIYRRLETHIAGHLETIAAATGPAYYRAQIRAHITAIAAHPEYMRILFQEGTQHSERLAWLVEHHQNRMTALLTALIERGQGEGYVPAVDPVHAKFIFSGAFVLPFVLAAEYRLISDDDPLEPSFIDRHIDTCLRLLFPTLVEGTPHLQSY
jgi:TetR/AcrR family transcriptional regulator